MLFLLSSFPLGLFWFVVLVMLLLVGLALTIVWVGLPILAFALPVCVLGAGTERWRLAALLGTRVPPPTVPCPRGSVLARLRSPGDGPGPLARPALPALCCFPIGLVELVVVLVLAISAVLVSYPLWFWTLPDGQGVMWTGVFVADTAPEALLVTLVGLVLA